MWHTLSIAHIAEQLHTDPESGLTHQEASHRLSRHGPNLLPKSPSPPLIVKFLAQFKNLFVIILLIAAAISFGIGETVDAVVISCIMILNALIGFAQELQAETSLKALQSSDVASALVVRSKTIEKIPVADIVPGDVIILEEGEKIPADARIIESFNLRVNESLLTGESDLTAKHARMLTDDSLPIADRRNMVYKDTTVQMGRGRAIIIATGKDTEVGHIAAAITQTPSEKTPLSKELDTTAQRLTYGIGIIAVILFGLNIANHESILHSLLVSIAIAVAAIPEGLPTIVTLVLSLGITRLARKKAIIKKLMAAETLGAVRIIATDKTGTITQNKINVVAIYPYGSNPITIEGEGYSPTGTFFDTKRQTITNPREEETLVTLLQAAVLASNAAVTDRQTIIGDTTEGALLVAATRASLSPTEIHSTDQRIFEYPFTSERKMMSVIVRIDHTDDHILYAKGAPEIILHHCTHLTDKEKDTITRMAAKAAVQGLRTIAIARKRISASSVKEALENDHIDEDGLEYLGFVSMQDPLRPEVPEAIAAAKRAGIRTIMITGDHKDTARAIAEAAGILNHNDTVVTESEITSLSDEQLTKLIVGGVNVFARISPLGKLRLVNAMKAISNTQIAVTGDGVNDAPALQAAHIGIAMGKSGTDLTREVADMVVTDDNYATIIAAVAEGRVIFANLVKSIRYLISCNISEVLVVTLGVLTGYPQIISPIQILWINLITDGFPALALGMEPAENNAMHHPPRDISRGILTRSRWYFMIIEGHVIGLSTFALYIYALRFISFPVAQTLAFSALGISQLVHAFNNRSTRLSLLDQGLFSNPYLLAACSLSFLLQLLVVQTPWGNQIFGTVPLDRFSWLILLATCLAPLAAVELKKLLYALRLP